jgi:hypothetical protein
MVLSASFFGRVAVDEEAGSFDLLLGDELDGVLRRRLCLDADLFFSFRALDLVLDLFLSFSRTLSFVDMTSVLREVLCL